MTTQQGSSSSLSFFPYRWNYEVFLSFRGEDTRIGFTGNLYNSLYRRGIHTFIDDAELKSGEEITPSLVKAIEESRIAIVVFSENFALSRFCLEELVKIIDCIKAKGQLVLPIFYMVDPSQVRHQTGSYAEALNKHKQQEPENVMKKWRTALSKAANLSGYHYEGRSSEYEYEFIERIIKEVSSKLKRNLLYIADYPIGLKPRLREVNSLLDVQTDDGVIMIGIYGIGGIGKSTIARAVYNLIADGFNGLCFLANIREKLIKQGLAQLQEAVLSELTGETDIKFGDVCKGIPMLKSRLNQKKVLLVLDDIDKLEQLQALAGGVDWFGSGSRIIITTRDTHLLSVHGIERVYNMMELNHEEALELFNWKAFKRREIDPEFQAILDRAVHCGHGLPLALEAIGSNLNGKKIDEWNSALDKYEVNSDEHVQEVLKVSYYSLEQDEKEIFLDVVCFFNGKSLQYVKNILLHSHGFSPEYAIGVLIEKSLIKLTKNLKSEETVEIHHLIQDMGQKIVKQESPIEPGRRSRLWFYDDIIHVLEENTGFDKIQFIELDVPELEVQWSGDEFKKMINLRVLIVKSVNFSQEPKSLPKSLRVLDWKRYPSSSLPSQFHPKKLVILNLCDGMFTWNKTLKNFKQLKQINFEGCNFLARVPDISESPKLTELLLDGCQNLIEIHDSIGFLDKLKIFSAKSCPKLKIFPHSLMLKSLERLNLDGCLSLQYFPEILGNMENLSYISLRETAIEELPCSIQNVTGLSHLDLSYCKKLKKVPTCILKLPKLKKLLVVSLPGHEFVKNLHGKQNQVISYDERIDLWGCTFLDGFLPMFLSCFQKVESLDLHGSNLTILPECIQACKFLTDLNLDNCKQLQEIRGIPPNIRVFSAHNCTSLMHSSVNLLFNQNMLSRGGTAFTYPGTMMPNCFHLYGNGASLSFWFRYRFPDIALFVVGGSNVIGSKCLETTVSFNGHEVEKLHRNYPELETEHTFLYDLCCQLKLHKDEKAYPVDEWIHAEISHVFITDELGIRQKALAQQTGIYIYGKDRIGNDILFTKPNPKPLKWNYQILGLRCCLLLLSVMGIASGYRSKEMLLSREATGTSELESHFLFGIEYTEASCNESDP